MKRLRIFDIDGTILYPGCDLWYMTTRSLSQDIESFEKFILLWKNGIKEGLNFYQTSESMMQKGIDLLPDGITGSDIGSEAKRISINIIQNGNYFKGAIQHIDNSINKGFLVILSTANYLEACVGFLKAIIECSLVEKNYLNRIIVSGSRVNWKNKKLVHFNICNNKIKDICETLDLAEDELIKNIDSFFGDDPEGNDSALLNYPIRGFIIKNDSNKNCPIPKNIIMTDWDEILRYYP